MKNLLCAMIISINVLQGNSMNEDAIPAYLYKVTSPELWQQSKDKEYLLLTEHDHDFIHLAREDQLEHIIEKFWKSNNKPYVVLKLDTSLLQGQLKFEANQPGGNKYYHLYQGAIPIRAVAEIM